MSNVGGFDSRIDLDDFLSSLRDNLTNTFKEEHKETTDMLDSAESKRTANDYLLMEDSLKALEDIKEQSGDVGRGFVEIKDALLEESQETQQAIKSFVMEFDAIIKDADFTSNTQTATIKQWVDKNSSILNSLNINNEATSGFLENSLLKLANIEKSSSNLLKVQKIDLDRSINRDKEDKRRENIARSTKNEGIFGEFFNKLKSFGLIITLILGSLLYASSYFNGSGKWLDPIKKFVNVVIHGIGKLATNLIDGLKVLGPKFEEFGKVVLPFIGKVLTSIVNALIGLGPAISWITSSLLTVTTEYVKLYSEFPLVMSIATEGIIRGIKKFKDFIAGPLATFSTWIDNLGGLGGKIVSVGKKILDWGKTILGWVDNVTGIVSKIAKFGGIFLKFFKFLGWPMTIIMSIVDFVKGWQNTEGNYVDKFIGGIKQIFYGLVEPFVMIWDWLKTTDMVGPIIAKISSWFTGITDFFKNTDFVGIITGKISGWANDLMNWLSEFNIFHLFINFMKDVWGSVVKSFSQIFKGDMFGGITNLITLLPRKILEHVLLYLRNSFGDSWGVGTALDWLLEKVGITQPSSTNAVNPVTGKDAPIVVAEQSTNKNLNDIQQQKNAALKEGAKKTEDSKKEEKTERAEQNKALRSAAEASVTASEQQKASNASMASHLNNMVAHTSVGQGQGGNRGVSIPVGPDMLATLSNQYWAPK